MYWIYLTLAILSEVFGTTSMKYSEGFTKPIPSTLVVFFYITSLIFFNFALKKIEIGVAYAIWSGVGTALLVCVGHFHFAEPLNWIKIASIILIVLGVIGLHLGGSAQDVRFK